MSKQNMISNPREVNDIHSLESYVEYLQTKCRIPVLKSWLEQRKPFLELKRIPKEEEIEFMKEQGMCYIRKNRKGSNRPREIFYFAE